MIIAVYCLKMRGLQGIAALFSTCVLPAILLAACVSTHVPNELVASSKAASPEGFRWSLTSAPQIINVSAYDPKERQRKGSSYSVNDLSALRRNGALGLIARCGKGRKLDEKCAAFLLAAELSLIHI